MPFAFPVVAYGRLPQNPAWVDSLPTHTYGAAGPAPATLMRSNLTWTPSLVENDMLPTCSVAGLINSARISTLINGQFDLTAADPALLAFYASLAGCADTPSAISVTDGLQLQAVLEAAAAGQFTAGEQAPLVPLFRSVSPITGASIRDAISQFGSAYLGITLYEADVQQGAEWIGGIESAGDPIGGHCVLAFAYDETTFQIATWGSTMIADDAFLQSRTDEAYGLVWTLPMAVTMPAAPVAWSEANPEGVCPRVGDPPV